MRTFNLVKSLTRVINNYKGLLILCAITSTFGVEGVWGESTTKYSKATAIASPTGAGSVYVSNSSSGPWNSPTAENSTKDTESKATHRYYFYASDYSSQGYTFKGWANSETSNSGNGSVEAVYEQSIETSKTDKSSAPTLTQYAIYAKIESSPSSIDLGNVVVGENQEKSFSVTHVHAATISASAEGNFSVTAEGISSTQAETTSNITALISVSQKGSQSGKMILSGNGISSEIALSAIGFVRPEIVWVDGDEQTIESGAPLNPGDLLRATCTTGAIDEYTYDEKYFTQFTDEDNNTYLQVREDITATGSITKDLTAHVPEATASYVAEGSSTISVNITNKTRLQIEWTDNISDLDNSVNNFPYTMDMNLTVKTRSGETITGKTIYYEVTPNNDYVDISGKTLTVKGAGGPTTIRAYVIEEGDYSGASTTKTVMVYNLGDVCDKGIGPYEYTLKRNYNDYEIPEPIKLAGILTFKFSRETAMQTLTVTEYGASETILHETKYDYDETGDKTINLQTNTVRIKFNAPITGRTGQNYKISNIKVTRRTSAKVTMDDEDITGKTKSWALTNVPPFEVFPQSLTINYSNRMVCAKFETGNQGWTVDKKVIGKCGEEGSGVLTLSFSSTAPGNYSDKLILFDGDGEYATINLSASVTKPDQILDTWNLQEEYNTTDKQTLSAKTTLNKTDFTFSVVSSSPANIVNIDANGVITFNGSGTATINAHIDGDDTYQPLDVPREITISKVTPTISSKPTATITYGQKLNTVSLNGGAAKVNPFRGQATDHTVAGTFAWTNGEYTVVETGGTTHEYDVTFTPTGDEKELYNNASGKATVTVNKITPTLTAKNEEDLEVYVNDTQTPKLNLVDYITSYSAESDAHGHKPGMSAITYTCDKSSTGIVTNDKKFYATAPGTYTITATAPPTDYYNSQTTTFTIKAINYYYSQAKSIVATNTTTGKDGGWVSVWQNSKDSATIGDGSWLHEDQTSNYKRLTETTHPYYFRAKVGTGYTFAGWFTSAEATVAEYTKPTYDGNFTILNRDRENPWFTRYAKFTPITYIVKFVGNGNTGGSMSDQTFTYDVAQNLTANGFTRTGWSFTGWKDGNENTYTNKQSVNNLASTQGAVITMTAQWNQDVYTVTLDPATYGTGGTAQISVKYNELIPASIIPPTQIDPAYIFLGYYDGDTQYYNADGTAVSGKKWPFTEGKTLIAKWQSGDYIKSWDVADSYTAQSNIPYDIAKSFSGAPVTYSIEGTDEGVIIINNTSKYIHANKKGKVMITACPVLSEGYSSVTPDTHEITVVGKEQRISWNQSFSFTTQPDGSIDETVALTAKAIDASTGVETGNSVWYSVGNSEMAEILGNASTGYSLHVKLYGTGSTTITAHVDGTEVYESGELEFTIRIYIYGDKCHVDVMTYSDEKEVGEFHNNLTISSDKFTGAPTDSLYIQIKREGSTYGEMQIYAENSSTQVFGKSLKRDDVPTLYKTFGFDLSAEDVNKVRIESKSAVKYTIKDIRVTQKSYLRTNLAQDGQYYPIKEGIYVNESYSKQFTISYSAKHQVMWQITNTSKKDDWNLRIVGHTKRNQSTTDYTNDCKDWGTYTFELSTTHVWLTQEDIKDTITIKTSDGNDAIVIPVRLTVGLGALYQFAADKDNEWNTLQNWHKEGSSESVTSLPDMRNKVEIYAPVRITEPVTVYGLTIKENTATKGSVTIAPTGGLTVYNGGVVNLDYALTIESSQENQGFFRMSPDASTTMTPMPIATTQLATRSTLDEGANDDAVWQYIGTPAKTYDPSSRTLKDGLEFTVDYITWLYEWSEPNGWVDMKNVSQPVMLKPFTGYAITQYGKPVYEFTGQLLNSNVSIPLTCTNEPGMLGDNVIANSYTSPIDVTLVDQTDFEGGNVIQAFYVFNSGSYNQWKEQNKEGDGRGKQSGSLNNYTPGQYIAIPTKSGAALGENELTMIAPMQGFDIYATEKGKTAYFNLNYRKHVWNATNARGQMNQPLRAPKADDTYMPDDVARQYAIWDSINAAKQACIDAITHRVRLIAYGENSGNDRVVIIESPLYAKQYENGADAPKMFAETDGLLGLYTNEQDCGLMSVNATNSVDGMFVGFRAGSDSEYELSASNVIGQPLRLIDLQTQQMIDLKDSATYTFTAEPNSQDDFRFQIINQDIHTNPTGWGGLGAKAKIWYYKQTLYVSDAAANSTAAIYTADGVTLKQVTFNHNTTISTADMPEGVYTVRVEDSVLKFFVKH